MTGKVKFWHPAGWGIITPQGVRRGDRKKEVFVHVSKLPEGMQELADGQEVEFSLHPDFGEKEHERRVLSLHVLSRQSYVPINVPLNQGKKAVACGD